MITPKNNDQNAETSEQQPTDNPIDVEKFKQDAEARKQMYDLNELIKRTQKKP